MNKGLINIELNPKRMKLYKYRKYKKVFLVCVCFCVFLFVPGHMYVLIFGVLYVDISHLHLHFNVFSVLSYFRCTYSFF